MFLFPVLILLSMNPYSAFQIQGLSSYETPYWQSLRQEVGGRLFQSKPYSAPCFENGVDSVGCDVVVTSYLDEATAESRTNHPSAYIQTQWETCQATNEQCLLDPQYPNLLNGTWKCTMGSVAPHYIDVLYPSDVKAAFRFTKDTNIPLVIKNTGHDYHGRSSAPGSLALWTHNLKNMTFDPAFIPEGCNKLKESAPGITFGAGVQWGEAYEFADQHNRTVVGGADKAVGVIGWLLGGGHSPLSNTMGLGVDRVLQFKVVTPDGEYRLVNRCQNQDLFFALRGGGGGTFGVVMEATVLASPAVLIQASILTFSPNIAHTHEMWTILTDNGLKWSQEGWGGLSMANVAVHVNPKLNKADASASMAPLVDFSHRLKEDENSGVKLSLIEFPSWYAFFRVFADSFVAAVGTNLALTSRLVSKSNLETSERRNELVSGLLAAQEATPGLILLMTTPASTPSTEKTSVTEAWRSSLYHVTVISRWAWNATQEQKRQGYKKASASIDTLRKITPDAAYYNEADVYEPNHQVAFWGTNYPALQRIKRKYSVATQTISLIAGTVWVGIRSLRDSSVIFRF